MLISGGDYKMNYKVKIWDTTGKPLFSIKDSDPKKLRKMFDKAMRDENW